MVDQYFDAEGFKKEWMERVNCMQEQRDKLVVVQARREIAEWLEGDCPHYVTPKGSACHLCGICCHTLYAALREGKMPE